MVDMEFIPRCAPKVYWHGVLGHELAFRAYAGDVVKVPFSVSVQACSVKGCWLEVI